MAQRPLLELLARLPARFWLQAALGLLGFVVLAVLGFALIAGVAAALVIVVLGFKARDWLRRLFTGRPSPPVRTGRQVIDVQYEIVERKDDRP